MANLSLTASSFIKKSLVNRGPQLIIRVIALAGFILAILAGFWGTAVGNHNMSIVIVWIAWWAFLMLIAVPFFGRGWCTICPIPMPGEWAQQGTLLGPIPNRKTYNLGWKWPKKLRVIWLQNGFFLMLALFSTVILTQPTVTAIVLAAFLAIAFVTSILFERRAFCNYLCPVGGFIGLYSQVSPIELRVVDTSICASHQTKTCYVGNEEGYGCPWGVYPPALTKNNPCGACMECLRTCPHDNILIRSRPFGADLLQKGRRKLDEAYKAFIMLGSAIIYIGVLLGPWGSLKMAAYSIGSNGWWIYILSLLFFTLVFLPGTFHLVTYLGTSKKNRRRKQLRKNFSTLATIFVPIGFAAWAAFSISFLFINGSYILAVFNDPFGWGWSLFGLTDWHWQPVFTTLYPPLQAIILLIGLWGSIRLTKPLIQEINEGKLAYILIVIYQFTIWAGIVWLTIG